MPFLTNLELRYLGSGKYETTAPLVYRGQWDTITVPTRFKTDLASIPRLAWALLPPFGTYERSAVLHDWLCVRLAEGDSPVAARDADGLFRRCSREAQVALPIRWLLWWGVRLGALGNPARRAGWWKDLPLIVLITVLVFAAALIAELVLHLCVDWVLSLLPLGW